MYNGIKVETMKRDRIKELTMALEQAMQRSPHERLLQLIYNALAAQSQLSPNLHYFHVTDEQLLAALNSYSCEPPQPILQRPFEIVKEYHCEEQRVYSEPPRYAESDPTAPQRTVYCLVSDDAYNKEKWITVQADSLDEAVDLAYKLPDVAIVLEVSWIPGGVIT